MGKPSNRSGKLVLLIGPSGVGKSAIMRRLRELHPEFHYPRSATTRRRRAKEGDEVYHFLSNKQFDRLLEENKVLEWAIVHEHERYATICDEILPFIDQGKIVLREVDVQGYVSIQNHPTFKDKKHPLQSIFILPESKSQIVKHIMQRAPMTEEELQRRLHSMDRELQYADHTTAKILNREGMIDQSVKAVEKIILD